MGRDDADPRTSMCFPFPPVFSLGKKKKAKTTVSFVHLPTAARGLGLRSSDSDHDAGIGLPFARGAASKSYSSLPGTVCAMCDKEVASSVFVKDVGDVCTFCKSFRDSGCYVVNGAEHE